MTAALSGLRIVEIGSEIAGPYCTKLLVDLGAEVTKIESPAGDSMRGWGPFPGGVPDPDCSGCSSISTPESTEPLSISRVRAAFRESAG